MPSFGSKSLERLATCHPLLQKVLLAAIKDYDFTILETTRNKADQEAAFNKGNSKAHFGQSAHNYSPSVAVDIAPYPIDWDNNDRFKELADIMLKHAKELKVPLQWGGAWKGLVDMPHFELSPWRHYI